MEACKGNHLLRKIWESAKRPILAFLLALAVGAIMIAISGYNPFWVYYQVFALAFSSTKNIASVFAQATPLMFSGIAYAIAAKCGLVNLGLEGQMLSGAMVSALLGAYLTGLPLIIHLPIAVLGGALAGAFTGGLTAYLKNRFGAREIITTVMLNEIVALLVSFLCNGPFRAEGSIWGMTEKIQDSAMIARIIKNTQLTYAIFLALILGILLEILLKKSSLGYKMQVIGQNLRAAKTAGINVNRVFLISFALSGALAGLCGAAMILGVNYKFIDGFSDSYGWSGISVAALAAYDPFFSVISAILFGVLKAGAMILNRSSNVPKEFVSVIQAFVVVFVAAPRMIDALLSAKWLKRLIPSKRIPAKEGDSK